MDLFIIKYNDNSNVYITVRIILLLMGRLKRNRENMTTIAIPKRLQYKMEQELCPNETMAQRCEKIYNIYRSVIENENSGPYWYEQYQKMKKQFIELIQQKEQTQWMLQ